MSHSSLGCIESEELEQFLIGQLSPARTQIVSTHLAKCDLCAERCGKFDFQQLPIVKTLKKISGTPRVALLSECDQLIAISQPRIPISSRQVRETSEMDTTRLSAESTDDGGYDCVTAVPSSIGRYSIRRLLGRGGMGSVYEAYDERLHRSIAIKFPHQSIQSDPQARKRFQIEARAAAAIHHPHVCGVLDSDEHDGLCFLTMPLLTGMPLSERLQHAPRLHLAEVIRIVIDLCRALAAVHIAGITHRDVKPSNIFLQANGIVTLMDFGVAISDGADDRVTRSGALVGTPKYFAPEQARGDAAAIGPQTDIYAIGAILFELLSGAPPYSGLPGEIIGRIQLSPTPRLCPQYQNCDASLIGICGKAMAKSSADRFANAGELAQALEEWSSSHPEALAQSSPACQRSYRTRWLGGAAMAACLLFTIFAFNWHTPWGELSIKFSSNEEKASTKEASRLPVPQRPRNESPSPPKLPEQRPSSTVTPPITASKNTQALISRETLERFAAEHRTNIFLDFTQTASGTNNDQVESPVVRVEMSLDGRTMAFLHEGTVASVWQLEPQKRISILQLPRFDTTLALSPKGETLVTAGGGWHLRFWDLATSREIASLGGHSNWINTIAFDHENQWVASISKDRTLRTFDSHTYQERWSINPGSWPRALAVSNSSRQIATGCNDGTIKFWDSQNGQPLGNIIRCDSAIVDVHYSVDDKQLASLDLQGKVNVWDLETGAVLWSWVGHPGAPLTINPHGDLVAFTDADLGLHIVRITDGGQVWNLPSVESNTAWKAIGFSADNRQIYSLVADAFVCVSDFP